MNLTTTILNLMQSGFGNLAAYLAAHVLLCLLPAFFIAGGLTALVPKEAVTRFLGRSTPKFVSYPVAALAGSLLAVCSCTIVPLFAGIYEKGAGLGPAITFLFFAPAGNILALAYTGVAIGADLAFARLFLSLSFGIGIGLIMALIFRKEDAARDEASDALFAARKPMRRSMVLFLFLLAALLIAGTLKVDLLSNTYVSYNLPLMGTDVFQSSLDRLVPSDTTKGEEGVSVQGVVLITLLGLIGFSAWQGIDRIHNGFNRWVWVTLALTALTLLVGSLRINPHASVLEVAVTGRTIAIGVLLAALAVLIRLRFSVDDLRDWLWESWRFVKQIFPLLIVGVFTVGVIRQLIRPEWIKSLAGSNSLLGNIAGVLFGVFMYFPTLVEVPIANMFLSLGMHRGPLLAYLMADPELSLQSIIILAAIIGRLKAWTYVGWVAFFSTLAGLIYGWWVDGTPAWLVALIVAACLAGLAALLHFSSAREQKNSEPQI